MIKLEEITEKIYHIEAQLPGVSRKFSIYLIREREGVCIHPGPTSAAPFLEQGMRQLEMRSLSYIIPTHIHVDDGGGMGKLAKLFPEALAVVHPRGVKHVLDPARLTLASQAIYGERFEVEYGTILPVPESQVKLVEDGEVIAVDGRELQIFHAPGHAPHHIIIFDKKTRGLFCGQSVGVSKTATDPFPLPSAAPPDFNLEDYLATLEQVQQLRPALLIYPFGEIVKEPEPVISKLRENTQLLGNLILIALREEKAPVTIAHDICQYATAHLGLALNSSSLEMTILGYINYFKKKGII